MADLEAAAQVLNGGEKVAILAGAGALHARAEVLAVADKLAAPVIKSASWPPPAASCSAPWTPWTPISSGVPRSSDSSRAAPRSSGPTPAN
jgi:hypothetical protein